MKSFGYTEDEIVSTDIIGTNYGSLFDATQNKSIDRGRQTTGKKQLAGMIMK